MVSNGLPDVETLARDAHWLPHRYDPGQDAFHFRKVDRNAHRKATFLTDEYLGEEEKPVVLRRQDVLAVAPIEAPLHLILHSAFCCSTLLARAFDVEGRAMGLKEPQLLNDLTGWRQRGADPRALSAALDGSLALLARPFADKEAVVIKPSNVFNGLAPAALALRPQSKALLLHAPLDTFLKSVAKKGMWGRLWVRELFVKLLKDGLVDLGFDNVQILGLTDLQAAAVCWLAQQAHFGRMAEQFGPHRIATLNSETLMAHPETCMTALALHFEIGLSTDAVAQIIRGPAFSEHSKTGNSFGAAARTAEYANAAEIHGEEIGKVSIWAEAVADNSGVSFVLPLGLLDQSA